MQPIVGLFDGVLVHSRSGDAPTLDGLRSPARSADDGVAIRDDQDVPVLVVITETDLTALGYGYVDQPDTELIKVWETAGTAHADAYLLQEVYGLVPTQMSARSSTAPAPLNAGPQHEFLQAALRHFIEWVIDGTDPLTLLSSPDRQR